MRIDFGRWLSEWLPIEQRADAQIQGIVQRDTAFQQTQQTTTTVLAPEAEEAARTVKAALEKSRAGFHAERSGAIRAEHLKLLSARATLAAQSAEAERVLEQFEDEANRFLRRTGGRQL